VEHDRAEWSVKHRIPDVKTAERCVDSISDHLYRQGDPLAASDLLQAVKLLRAAGPATSKNVKR
jgi:hypothetical protein